MSAVNCDVCGKEAKNSAGLAAHKRFNHSKKELSEEAVKAITDGLSGKATPTVEETLALTTRVGGNAVTKSGIVIPAKVIAGWAPTKFKYVISYSESAAVVHKVASNGREVYVRTYERSVHGDNFRALAEQFCAKNNR